MHVANTDLVKALQAQTKLFRKLLPDTFQGLQAVMIAGAAGLVAMSHVSQNAGTPAEIDQVLAAVNEATASLLRSWAAGDLRGGKPPPPVLMAWYAQQTRSTAANMIKTPGRA